MKAVYRYGIEPKQYEMREMPEPVCGPFDVILKVEWAAICGSDLNSYYNGGAKGGICIVGHEFAGTVYKVGENVTDWKPGDRVACDNTGRACGKCFSCSRGLFAECVDRTGIGFGLDGGWTTYVRIPGDVLQVHKWCLVRVPDNVPFEYAAIMDPICNAYKAVAQESGLLPGETAVVFGPGPIGLLAAQICHIMGAKEVILVGLGVDKDTRADVAKEMGVTEFIASDREDLMERIHALCGPEGADVAIDCAGAPIVLQQCINCVHKNGSIVRLGASPRPLNFSIDDLTFRALRLKGHHAYDPTTWRNAMGLLEKGMLNLDPLITHKLPLDQWEEGMRIMRDREGIKILLKP